MSPRSLNGHGHWTSPVLDVGTVKDLENGPSVGPVSFDTEKRISNFK